MAGRTVLKDKEAEIEEYKAKIHKELIESEECKRFIAALVKNNWEVRFHFKLPKRRGRPKGSKNKRRKHAEIQRNKPIEP